MNQKSLRLMLLPHELISKTSRGLKQRIINSWLLAFLLALGVFMSASATTVNNTYYRVVTGKVVDPAGVALSGVSVLVKGSTTGTTTDANGDFSIDVPAETSVLVFSHIGYISQEITVGNQRDISVTLIPDGSGQSLSDVVVVGYGTQKKVTVTGAVAQVKGTELAKTPTVNLSNTLAGRLPGVIAINTSGEPGYDGSSIRIRGINSIGNSSALVVIDGVPGRDGGLERLNAADIESISVLKDAAAAIYGSRAANGVILITTKRGKSGKPMLSYTFNQGWAQPTRIPKMSSVTEYGEMRNELMVYENVPTSEWDAAYKALTETGSYTKKDGGVVKSPQGFFPEDMAKYRDGSDPWLHPNTDWFDAVFKPWSPQIKHNLQINGGSESVKYLASVGYQNQDAYYRNSATYYKQYDVRLNLDAKINKYINVGVGIVGREEVRNFPTRSAGDIFWMLMRGKPNEQAIWPNGLPGRDIEYGNNPVVITTNQTGYQYDKRDYIQSNGKVEILIPGVEGLKITGMAAIDKQLRNGKWFQTPWYLWQWNGEFETDGKTPKLVKTLRSNFTDTRLTQSAEDRLNTNLSAQINYDKTINDHTLNFLVGTQRENIKGNHFDAYRRYFISSVIDDLFAGGDAEKTNNGYSWNGARSSYFGRVGYNYLERYMAEFLWRYDGSYVFPKAGRWGFFPGVTAGWRISEENFFAPLKGVINNLKLRGSWGQMGAEPYIGGNLAEYYYLSTYAFGTTVLNDVLTKTLYETRLPNPSFTWEVGNNSNIGLDMGLLNNRLTIELDAFYNKRTGALIQNTGIVPATLGQSLPPVNLGQLDNKGFEFKISYADNAGDLRYNFGINGGYNKNKIVFWSETPSVPDYQKFTGKRLGPDGPAFLVYMNDGVFVDQAAIDANKIDYSALTNNLRPGDLKYKDYNNDGKINSEDMVRLNQTREPVFQGGITGNMQFRNFDFSFLFQAAMGGLTWFRTGSSGDIGNYLQYVYDTHWSIARPSSVHPRIASRDNTWYTNWNNINDYWLRNNNYIRLKNIELGYTIPMPANVKSVIDNVRIFANALNLVTWDKMKIWDPESIANEGVMYPQSRIINIGGTVTF